MWLRLIAPFPSLSALDVIPPFPGGCSDGKASSVSPTRCASPNLRDFAPPKYREALGGTSSREDRPLQRRVGQGPKERSPYCGPREPWMRLGKGAYRRFVVTAEQ